MCSWLSLWISQFILVIISDRHVIVSSQQHLIGNFICLCVGVWTCCCGSVLWGEADTRHIMDVEVKWIYQKDVIAVTVTAFVSDI